MKTSEFIHQVQRRIKWIAFFAAITFVISIFIYHKITELNKGEVTLLIPSYNSAIANNGATEAEKFAFGQQSAITSMRLLNLIYSDEMIKHIVGYCRIVRWN